MVLTEAEKRFRKLERMLEKAREYTVGTYCNKYVAPVFQRMIRAEAAVSSCYVHAVKDGVLTLIYHEIGDVVCVTCGAIGAWSGGLGGMHTGHYLASRRNSILFEEANCAVQCSRCNRYCGGMPTEFTLWMEEVRGLREITRLWRLKGQSRQFTREELVEMRLDYQDRLNAAKEVIG